MFLTIRICCSHHNRHSVSHFIGFQQTNFCCACYRFKQKSNLRICNKPFDDSLSFQQFYTHRWLGRHKQQTIAPRVCYFMNSKPLIELITVCWGICPLNLVNGFQFMCPPKHNLKSLYGESERHKRQLHMKRRSRRGTKSYRKCRETGTSSAPSLFVR